MTFRAAAGTTIRDFTINRQVYYYNPIIDGSGTAPPYILYSWDGLRLRGRGRVRRRHARRDQRHGPLVRLSQRRRRHGGAGR